MGQKLIEKILSNSSSGTEREQFEIWLGESEDHQRYFEQVKAIWTRMDGVYNKADFDLELVRLKVQSKIRNKKPMVLKTNWYYRIAVAASIVVLLAVGFLIYNQSNKNSYKEFASGEVIKNIEFKDGSHVWLNKNSILKLPANFSRKDRTVILKGEAYFEVKRDETKPFKVITSKTVTKVLGTSFNIHEDSLTGNVDLDVKTGRVAFSHSGWRTNAMILLANEQAQFEFSDKEITKLDETDLNYLAWKTGVLKFDKTPLKKVCTDLSKYYGVNVETADENNELELTGNFRNEQLENILSSIAITLEVKISHQGLNYTIERQ